MQGLLTTLLLPPVVLVLMAIVGGLLAWRCWRPGGLAAAGAGAALLLLATPMVGGLLTLSLEREAEAGVAAEPAPSAIVVLGAEVMRTRGGGFDIGPLTLERLKAAAELQRATQLPVLVTGGPLARDAIPLAALMAQSLVQDFGVPVRWREERATDTRENAVFSAALLHADGIAAAYVVTHGWHLPRAREAFGRVGYPVSPVPVRRAAGPTGEWSDWIPRPDHFLVSWYMIREWLGRIVYAIRDGNSEFSTHRR